MKGKIKRHLFFYTILRPVVYLVAKVLLNYSCKPAPIVDGPYIVLANHTTNWDPVLVGCSFKKPMNFIASEHAMRMGFLSKIIGALFVPIQRVKGSTDASAALGMVSMLKKGISVGLFPEGSRSFDGTTEALHPTTGRLIKMSGASLITYRISGGYLTSPRWGYKLRRGKVCGEVVNIYTSEQIKAMSPQEITDCINRDIAENAFDRQREKAYKYYVKGNAEGIERVLYLCPECKRIGTISSSGSEFSCSCGMHATMNKYGFFEGEDLKFDSIDKWNKWQVSYLAELAEDENFRLCDEDQQLYAEIIYSWLLTRIDEIKASYHVDYLFCVISEEPYKEQFFLYSGAQPGAVRGTGSDEAYVVGTTVSVSESQMVGMRGALENSTHLANAGDYVDYYEYFGSFDNHSVFIGLTYNLSELRANIAAKTRTGTQVAIILQIILCRYC